MARFYECSKCDREFLGRNNIPDHEDGVMPVCERCQYPYPFICGICGDPFHPGIIAMTPDGEPVSGSTQFCQPCYAREVVPVEEEMALAGIDVGI